MLRRRLAVVATAVIAFAGVFAGGASALVIAPTAGPAHGFCTLPTASVTVSGTALTVTGAGDCLVNGVSTTGTLTISGRVDAGACPVRVGSGTAWLDLAAFGQVVGSARIVSSGASASLVVAGGLTGAGTFVESPAGRCMTELRWNGTLVF